MDKRTIPRKTTRKEMDRSANRRNMQLRKIGLLPLDSIAKGIISEHSLVFGEKGKGFLRHEMQRWFLVKAKKDANAVEDRLLHFLERITFIEKALLEKKFFPAKNALELYKNALYLGQRIQNSWESELQKQLWQRRIDSLNRTIGSFRTVSPELIVELQTELLSSIANGSDIVVHRIKKKCRPFVRMGFRKIEETTEKWGKK